MAQFIVFSNPLGQPYVLNVAYVEKLFIGDLVVSPTEQWPCLIAVDRDGTHTILRGEPQMLQRALYDMIWILAQGASVLVHPDGKVERYGSESS
jgi:hypothetical protein